LGGGLINPDKFGDEKLCGVMVFSPSGLRYPLSMSLTSSVRGK
jgi:hypothetical protein